MAHADTARACSDPVQGGAEAGARLVGRQLLRARRHQRLLPACARPRRAHDRHEGTLLVLSATMSMYCAMQLAFLLTLLWCLCWPLGAGRNMQPAKGEASTTEWLESAKWSTVAAPAPVRAARTRGLHCDAHVCLTSCLFAVHDVPAEPVREHSAGGGAGRANVHHGDWVRRQEL
jgi:hypothetical protein